MEQNFEKTETKKVKSKRVRKIISALLILAIFGGIFWMFLFLSLPQIRSKNLLLSFEKYSFNYSLINVEKDLTKNNSATQNVVKNLKTLVATSNVVENANDIFISIQNYGKFEYSNPEEDGDDNEDEYCYGEYYHIESGCEEVFKALSKGVKDVETSLGIKFALIKKGKILFRVYYSSKFKEDELPEMFNNMLNRVYGKKNMLTNKN